MYFTFAIGVVVSLTQLFMNLTLCVHNFCFVGTFWCMRCCLYLNVCKPHTASVNLKHAGKSELVASYSGSKPETCRKIWAGWTTVVEDPRLPNFMWLPPVLTTPGKTMTMVFRGKSLLEIPHDRLQGATNTHHFSPTFSPHVLLDIKYV
jgi:hypothetical protein